MRYLPTFRENYSIFFLFCLGCLSWFACFSEPWLPIRERQSVHSTVWHLFSGAHTARRAPTKNDDALSEGIMRFVCVISFSAGSGRRCDASGLSSLHHSGHTFLSLDDRGGISDHDHIQDSIGRSQVATQHLIFEDRRIARHFTEHPRTHRYSLADTWSSLCAGVTQQLLTSLLLKPMAVATFPYTYIHLTFSVPNGLAVRCFSAGLLLLARARVFFNITK